MKAVKNLAAHQRNRCSDPVLSCGVLVWPDFALAILIFQSLSDRRSKTCHFGIRYLSMNLSLRRRHLNYNLLVF